jgi:hypothetical protein
MKRALYLLTALSVLSLALFLTAGIASAHGKTTVGDYELEIGFHNEPVIVNQPNSLDLFITNSKTGQPVNGQEGNLKAEIIFGASKKSLEISPMDGVDGGYTAMLIPTAIGDYTWHITGMIENTPLDVSMTSSPTTFGSGEAAADYLFPPVAAQSAGVSPSTALTVGVLGVVLGAAGLIVGFMAMSGSRRPATKSPKLAPR